MKDGFNLYNKKFFECFQSSKKVTVCHCEHLTTFTLIFGNPKFDLELTKWLSDILGGTSIVALIFTQFFIILYK